ncbi:amidohydrolase family protein [Bordetella genomosp. 12]|uniref:Amidohydrolase n=1 Tax=Bordetella genomosp. 12 TaxID=463035 RepID=A0A261VWN1_9BORD|nr:amidohydrolase family protein [Bordetella genomosp. 12]OZI77703.1 amidohydrolase [Bordetella genomosp. 12]
MSHPAYIGNQPRNSADLGRWLGRRAREAALEPELPIIDAHHHLWDFPAVGNRYLLPDYLADVQGGHNIVASVYVEAAAMWRADGPEALRPVGEVEFAAGMAAMADSGTYGPCRIAAAIVAHADLRLGAQVREVLLAQQAAAGGRLRGIRHQVAHATGAVGKYIKHPVDADLMYQAGFRAGVAQLAPLGLSFDAWLYHPQLAGLRDLARAFPDTVIVLNHVGGVLGVDAYAGRQAQAFAQWSEQMAALADCPNVVVKLGGMGMPVFGFGFETGDGPPTSAQLAERWQPYIERCIGLFGAQRCLFESNFPVDRQSCDYNALWNAFKLATQSLPSADRRAVFMETARRVYRIAI